jgi:translation initiation factor 2-alpha kinase 4
LEYCEKKKLRDVIDGEIDEQEAWHLLRQLLDGLLHMHSYGMIHRDLKPHNIFLDSITMQRLAKFVLLLPVDTVNLRG